MNDVVLGELGAIKADSKSEFVFPSTKRDGIALVDVKRAFRSACKDAGIENLHFHDLRHTTGTRLGELGVDPFTIADVLGHSDVRMTSLYTHATDRARREAVTALAQYDETVCHNIVTMKRKETA
jgi:integrase